jgi:hypothetical protein
MIAEFNIQFVNSFHRETQMAGLSSELCLPIASYILLDFLNEMTAQFRGNQTVHLWNSKMNSRIPSPNDGYQTTSKLDPILLSLQFESLYYHLIAAESEIVKSEFFG